jgi:hypothetical protein
MKLVTINLEKQSKKLDLALELLGFYWIQN